MRRFAALALLLLLLGLTACNPATPTVVTLGDSVPAGAACDCRPFPALYATAQHATDVNLAESGETAAQLRTTIPANRKAFTAATQVVIMIGANDMAPDFENPAAYPGIAAAIEQNVTATITAIQTIHPARVLVLGYWNVVLDGQVAAKKYTPTAVRASAAATTAVNKALQSAATRTGATYIPTIQAFHGPHNTQDPTPLLAPDGDHPNAAGQSAIAALLPPLHP